MAGIKAMEVTESHLLGEAFIFFRINVTRVPAIPKPKRAVLMTNEPKFDQLPTLKALITYNS